MPREYEYTVPYTYNYSPSGTFPIVSPWNTPCEICVIGAATAWSGNLLIGPDQPPDANAQAAFFNGSGAPVRGIAIPLPATGFTELPPIFWPMGRQCWANWSEPHGTGSGICLIVIFRRALETLSGPVPPQLEVNPEDEHDWHRQYQEDVLGRR